MIARKILKYELLNIARNRWVFFYAAATAALAFAVYWISGDPAKAMVTLSSIHVILVPLIASLFASVYWYYNERFTELLLTQPMRRASVLLMRYVALTGALGAGFLAGTALPLALAGGGLAGILAIAASGLFLTAAFVGLALVFCVLSADRMKGVGLALGLWVYLVFLHDGAILVSLLAFRDYPVDLPAGVLGVLNPIGLTRVTLLMTQDASLLLGHSGMLVRNLLTSWQGSALAAAIALLILALPLGIALRKWERRDF